MKVKDLYTAHQYFSNIFLEENLPSIKTEWNNDFSDEEIIEFSKLHEKDAEIKKTHFVVSDRDELYWYEEYMVMNIGHSRRGQYYYILCHKETLELSILATKPDGDGCNVNIPNELFKIILNGDVVL